MPIISIRRSSVSLEMPNKRLKQITTYNQLTFPTELPVSLDLVKQQLRIQNTADDELLTVYINSASEFFEAYTGRILITKEFETFRSFFETSIELRRSRLQELIEFQYFNTENILVDVPDIFYLNVEKTYSRIIIDNFLAVPNDARDNIQTIRAVFSAGYGDTSDDVPQDIQMALMNHVAALYANRGDCSDCNGGNGIPVNALLIYNKYLIISLYGGGFREGV